MAQENSVTVLGGGISGITTAILLRLAGYSVEIITELVPLGEEYDKKNPRFQTVIAAASIIPHTVVADDINTILDDSQAFFRCFIPEKMVRAQKHYEVFEFPQPLPEYRKSLESFQELTEQDISDETIPKRSDVDKIYGWYYQAYFAEMPLYLRRLYELFDLLGGTIQRRKITKNDLQDISNGVIINCLGSWSDELFYNPYPAAYYRGFLLLVNGLNIPKDSNDKIFSYNYTPSKDIYSTRSGKANDIYFYPRSDVWIVGGSRQVGTIDNGNNWAGEETSQDTVDINGLDVPEPIVNLSKDILLNTTGTDITKHNMKAIVGYRYQTTPVRIERTDENGRNIVHNYGHGGAGVTISWGSAIKVLNLVMKVQVPPESLLKLVPDQPTVLHDLQKVLKNRMLE